MNRKLLVGLLALSGIMLAAGIAFAILGVPW